MSRAALRVAWLCLVFSLGCFSSAGGDQDATLDGGSSAGGGASPTALGKGPGDAITLPYPGERNWRYPAGDPNWQFVAPNDYGTLYDAAYFNQQWFVLHGEVENSEKAIVSEVNWLSSTRDGLTWETLTLTTEPFGSYTRLASNGHSLLLAGPRHVARLADDGIDVIDELDKDSGPEPVILPHEEGYVLGRLDDVLWLGIDGSVTQTYTDDLLQLHSGVATSDGFLLIGAFSVLRSSDGQRWQELEAHPCSGCLVPAGAAFGHGGYVVGDVEALYASSDGQRWDKRTWQAVAMAPLGEQRLEAVDFTAGHFVARTEDESVALSKDGRNWSAALPFAETHAGPAGCLDRCLVAGGRLLLPPTIAPDPIPPDGADPSSPYFCMPYDDLPEGCFDCAGDSAGACRPTVMCHRSCTDNADCPDPGSGNSAVRCDTTETGSVCTLYCDPDGGCPDGMECIEGRCSYFFDDPGCTAVSVP